MEPVPPPDDRPTRTFAGLTPGRGRAADEPLPRLPGYEVVGVLGRGGMGVVYQARQVALNRTVALKMIRAGARASAAELARFRAEAEACARLQHPHITQVYEVGEHAGRPFFSLEFVPNGTLAQALAGTPLAPEAAARLVETLARAVHAAHRAGVVHRDLKPANVLLTADCTPKVTDFGLAKLRDAGGALTATGSVMGTPSYMAPEQASGHTRDAGPAADVYALGAILYECLTGRVPFQGASAVETMELVRTVPPVPPRVLRPRVPADLEAICLRALAKRPQERPATAEALADELKRWREGGQEVEPVARPPAATPGPRRTHLVVAAGVALLMALAGWALSANARLHRQVADTLTAALAERDRAEQAEAARVTADSRRVAADNDARRHEADGWLWRARLAKEQGRPGEALAAYARAKATAHKLITDDRLAEMAAFAARVPVLRVLATADADARHAPAAGVSADGNTLVVASGAGVRVYDARTGLPAGGPLPVPPPTDTKGAADYRIETAPTAVRVVQTRPGPKPSLAYQIDAPAPNLVRVVRTQEGARGLGLLIDAATGKPAAVHGPDAAWLPDLEVSADGRTAVTADGRTARAYDVATGAPRTPPLPHGGVKAVAFAPGGRALATFADGPRDSGVRLWSADGTPIGDRGPLKGGWQGAAAGLLGKLAPGGGLTRWAFNADGSRLAVWWDDGGRRLYDTATGRRVGLPEGGDAGTLFQEKFSPDGRWFLALAGGRPAVYDAATGGPAGKPLDHPQASSAAFRPGSSEVVTASETDCLVRRWKLDGVPAGEPLDAGRPGGTVSYGPGGRWLVHTAHGEHRVWDAATGRPVFGDPPADGVVWGTGEQDGRVLVIRDGWSRWHDATTGRPAGPPLGGAHPVWGALSEDGRMLLSPGGRMFDAATGAAVPCPEGVAPRWVAGGGMLGRADDHGRQPARAVYTLWRLPARPRVVLGGPDREVKAVSDDGTRAVVSPGAGREGAWAVVDTATGRDVARLQGLTGYLTGVLFEVEFAPGGRVVGGFGYLDGKECLRAWDAATGRSLWAVQQKLLRAAAFAPAGTTWRATTEYASRGVLRFGPDATRWLDLGPRGELQLNGGKATLTLARPAGAAATVTAFRPDGTRVYLGTGDGSVIAWDAATGDRRETLTVPFGGGVTALAVGPGGAVAAAAGDWVWVWADLFPPRRFLQPSPATRLALRPDGSAVLALGRDGVLRSWDLAGRAWPDWLPDLERVPPEKLPAWAAAATGTDFTASGNVRTPGAAEWADRRKEMAAIPPFDR